MRLPGILAALLSAGGQPVPSADTVDVTRSRLKLGTVAFMPVYRTSRRVNQSAKRHARMLWRQQLVRKARPEGRKHWRWCHELVRPVKAARKRAR
jgi:hypothetical protein